MMPALAKAKDQTHHAFEEQQQKQLAEKEAAFLDLILRAYRAEKIDGFASFHGKRAGRLVTVGPVNLPITRLFVEEIILECRQKHLTKVDMLGFEFEMGLFPNVLDEARAKGIDIAPKYIPAEVFDKRAVEKNQVVFHDVSFIEVKPHVRAAGHKPDAQASEPPIAEDSLAGASGLYSPKTEWEEMWTGDFIFENEWQSFRTKKDRSLELQSVFHECQPGRRKIAVKVVDIFGNDTMTIIDVNVGNGGKRK